MTQTSTVALQGIFVPATCAAGMGTGCSDCLLCQGLFQSKRGRVLLFVFGNSAHPLKQLYFQFGGCQKEQSSVDDKYAEPRIAPMPLALTKTALKLAKVTLVLCYLKNQQNVHKLLII